MSQGAPTDFDRRMESLLRGATGELSEEERPAPRPSTPGPASDAPLDITTAIEQGIEAEDRDLDRRFVEALSPRATPPQDRGTVAGNLAMGAVSRFAGAGAELGGSIIRLLGEAPAQLGADVYQALGVDVPDNPFRELFGDPQNDVVVSALRRAETVYRPANPEGAPAIVGSGIGSVASLLVPGKAFQMGHKGVAVLSMLMGFERSAQMVEAAREAGNDVTELESALRIGAGTALGATEVLPIERFLGPMTRVVGRSGLVQRMSRRLGGNATAKTVGELIDSVPAGRLTSDALLTGAFEASQELLSEMTEAQLDRLLLDLQREPAIREALIGGGGAGFLVSAFFGVRSGQPMRVSRMTRESKQMLAAEVLEIAHEQTQAISDADAEVVSEADALSEARVQSAAEQATPAERQEALHQIDQTFAEDESAAPDERMTDDQQQSLRQVRQVIDRVERDTPAGEPVQGEPSPAETVEPPAVTATPPDVTADPQAEFTARNREIAETRALLERIGLRITENATVDVGEATRARFANQAVASRVADREARRQERAIAQQQLAALRDKNARAAANRRQLRQELIAHVRSRLPRNRQADLIGRIEKVRGRQAFESLLNRIKEIETEVQNQEIADSLRKTLRLVRKRVDRIDPEIRQRLEPLVEGVRERRLTPAEQERQRMLTGDDAPAELSPRDQKFLADAARKPVDDLDPGDAAELDQQLTALVKEASAANRLQRKKVARNRKRVAEEIRSELDATFRRKRQVTPQVDEPPSRAGLRSLTFGVIENAKLRDLGHIIGPTFRRIFYNDLVDGYGAGLRVMKAEHDWFSGEFAATIASRMGVTTEQAMQRMDEMSSAIMDRVGVLRTLTQLPGRTKARTDEFTFGEGDAAVTVSLTEAQQLQLIWMLKDPDVRQQVLYGDRKVVPSGLTTRRAFNISLADFQRMTDQMRADPAGSINRFELLDAMADEMFRRTNSGHLQQAMRDFMLETEGRDRTRPGEYAPTTARKLGKFPEEADDALNLRNFAEHSAREAGIIKSRSENAGAPLEIRDGFEVFDHYVSTVAMLTNLGPATINARKAMASPDVAQFLHEAKLGQRLETRLREYLSVHAMTASNTRGARGTWIGRMIGELTNNVSQAVLSYNIPIGLYQQLSVPMAVLADPKNGEVLRMSNLLAAWKTPAAQAINSPVDQEMTAHAPEIWHRFSHGPAFLATEGATRRMPPLGRGRKPLSEAQLVIIRAMDRRAIRTIWLASKRQGRQLGLEGDDLMEYAAEMTQRHVRETQPTSAPSELSAVGVARRLSPAVAPLAAFRSYTSQLVSALYRDTTPVVKAFRQGRIPSYPDMLRAGRTSALVAINTALVTMIGNAWFDLLASIGEAASDERKDFPDALADNFFGADAEGRARKRGEFLQGMGQRLASLWPVGGPMVSAFIGHVAREMTAAERPAFEPTDVLTRQFADLARQAANVASAAARLQFDDPNIVLEAGDMVSTGLGLKGIGMMAPYRDFEFIVRSMLKPPERDGDSGGETTPTRFIE